MSATTKTSISELLALQDKAGIKPATSVLNLSKNIINQAPVSTRTSSENNSNKGVSSSSSSLSKNGNVDLNTYEQQLKDYLNESKTNLKYLSQMDRRASLTVAPKMGLETPTLFKDKILYALGTKKIPVGERSFFNFLSSMLSGTGGIIFPYTPTIDSNYHINYETTEIPQSNCQYNAYKNSPPPSLSVTATFTANTKNNAAYMLSAIWFLQALSKCDVGNGTTFYTKDTDIAGGGLPPPILYFNAYHQLMENIPVVIQSFNLKYPDNIDYVNIIIDMENKNSSFFNIMKEESQNESSSSLLLTNSSNNNVNTDTITTQTTLLNDTFKMSFWLPLEMTIIMGFLIQPNLARENNVFNLDAYKAGILKNPKLSSALTSYGSISDATSSIFEGKAKDLWKNWNKKYLPTGWTW